MSRLVGRAGATAGLAIAAAAASAAVGLAAQRHAARRILRREDPEAGEDLQARLGESRQVRTDDDAVLTVQVSDPSSAPDDLTIVFAHGYALNATTWHYQFRDLADVARLVAYDQRGHGDSTTGSDPLSVERLARDLERIIDEVAPEGPLVLVGHSMGGMTVMALAGRRPDLFQERVVGTAFLATAADPGTAGELALAGPWGEIARRLGPGLTALLVPRPQLIERALTAADDLVVILTEHYGFGSQAPPSLVEHTKRMHALVPIEVLTGLLPAFEGLDLTRALEPVQHTETVIVVGETDRMTPQSHSQALLRLLPNADLVTLADTGHMLMMERYAEVNQVIRDLLVRVRRRRLHAV
jgi:pimeloyl-ACP methyl ester carboxylesterase